MRRNETYICAERQEEGYGLFAKVIHKSALQNGVLLGGILLTGGALLVWPEGVAGGISRGLSICGTVLIPSLFPFLVLAGLLVRSGLAETLGRRTGRLTRALFGLPGCCGAVILVGMVGGYPAGGLAVGELVRKGAIPPAEGRRLLRFCVNGGPAFIISAVGAGLLGSVRKGVLLFAAHIAVSLLMGIAGRRGGRTTEVGGTRPAGGGRTPLAAAFVESVNAAGRSLLYMCGFVILFAAVLALADVSGLAAGFQWLIAWPFVRLGADPAVFACVLPCVLEVSCGCVEAAGNGLFAAFLLGAALGWGGLSVHCQLAATLQEYHLLDRGFFTARFWHGLLAGGLSALLFRVAPIPVEVGTVAGDALIRPVSTSVAASVALLMMCSVLLLATDRERR